MRDGGGGREGKAPTLLSGTMMHMYICLQNPTEIGCHGNLLLDRLSSARMVVVPPDSLGGGPVEDQVVVTQQLMYGPYAEYLRWAGLKWAGLELYTFLYQC